MPWGPCGPAWFQLIGDSNDVQWLSKLEAGSDASIKRIVPVTFNLQALKTVPPVWVVAKATPPASANNTTLTAARRAARRREIPTSGSRNSLRITVSFRNKPTRSEEHTSELQSQ